MKKFTFTVAAILSMLLVLLPVALSVAVASHNFVAHLSGDGEALPVDMLARGQAIFNLNKYGTEYGP